MMISRTSYTDGEPRAFLLPEGRPASSFETEGKAPVQGACLGWNQQER